MGGLSETLDRTPTSYDRADESMSVSNRRSVQSWDPERVTVREALGRQEGARAVFRRFGLDTCCGGELPVAVAAERDDVDLDLLLDALAVDRAEVDS